MELYLANTPYHIILSILNGCLEKKSQVVLMDMSGSLEWYNSGHVIEFFSGAFHYENFHTQNILKKISNKNPLAVSIINSATHRILNITQKLNPNRIYIFNDAFPETQLILSKFPNTQITYIEDGSAPYNSHKVNHPTSKIVQPLLFGKNFERISTLGTSSKIQNNIFTHPDLARPENKKLPTTKLSANKNTISHLKDFSTLYPLETIKKEIKNRPAILLLTPPYHDELISKTYEEIAKQCSNAVLLKGHPIKNTQTQATSSLLSIPPYIPTEILIVGIKNIKSIYSYPSTSLISAKYIRPEIETTCILSHKNNPTDLFIENLKKCGIPVINHQDLKPKNENPPYN